MVCPRCGSDLKLQKYRGIEVEKCASCEGMWLDYPELDQLEDTVLNTDEVKGSLITRSSDGELPCPVCQAPMDQFRYRFNELWLDVCSQEHGFWLDKNEEKRVLELMEQRTTDLKRSTGAEQQWDRLLGRMRNKSFFQKIKDSLRG